MNPTELLPLLKSANPGYSVLTRALANHMKPSKVRKFLKANAPHDPILSHSQWNRSVASVYSYLRSSSDTDGRAISISRRFVGHLIGGQPLFKNHTTLQHIFTLIYLDAMRNVRSDGNPGMVTIQFNAAKIGVAGGYTRNTVQTSLTRLCEMGWISIVRKNPGGSSIIKIAKLRAGGQKIVNDYFDAIGELASEGNLFSIVSLANDPAVGYGLGFDIVLVMLRRALAIEDDDEALRLSPIRTRRAHKTLAAIETDGAIDQEKLARYRIESQSQAAHDSASALYESRRLARIENLNEQREARRIGALSAKLLCDQIVSGADAMAGSLTKKSGDGQKTMWVGGAAQVVAVNRIAEHRFSELRSGIRSHLKRRGFSLDGAQRASLIILPTPIAPDLDALLAKIVSATDNEIGQLTEATAVDWVAFAHRTIGAGLTKNAFSQNDAEILRERIDAL